MFLILDIVLYRNIDFSVDIFMIIFFLMDIKMIGLLDSSFSIVGRDTDINIYRKFCSREYQYESETKTLDYIKFWVENNQDVE